MLRVLGRRKQGPMLALGLSALDIRYLKNGQPIVIDGAEAQRLGLGDMELVLFYGKSEAEICETLEARGAAFPPRGRTLTNESRIRRLQSNPLANSSIRTGFPSVLLGTGGVGAHPR